MKHRIVIRCEGRSLRDFALKQQLSKCITAALAHQGVNTPCEINVLVTDDEGTAPSTTHTARSTRQRTCCRSRCLS